MVACGGQCNFQIRQAKNRRRNHNGNLQWQNKLLTSISIYSISSKTMSRQTAATEAAAAANNNNNNKHYVQLIRQQHQ